MAIIQFKLTPYILKSEPQVTYTNVHSYTYIYNVTSLLQFKEIKLLSIIEIPSKNVHHNLKGDFGESGQLIDNVNYYNFNGKLF